MSVSDIRSNSLSLKNAAGGATYATFTNGGSALLKHNNTDRLETTASGVTVTGNVTATTFTGNATGLTGNPTISVTDLDVDGHTNLDNVSVAGVSTFAGTVNTASIVATGIDLNGDIDVDGHTNLDNVNVAGVATFASTVNANLFSGSGASIIAINASNIATGTIAAARVPTLNQDTTGTATNATNFNVTANNTTNETVYPVFVDGATGTQGAETDTGLTYNPSTGLLTALKFSGDGSALTGISGSGGVTVQDEGSTLSTQASTLNFVGSGVVASGNGATKTITINAGTADTTDVRTNTLTVAGVSTFTGNIDANGDLDVDGHLHVDNVSIAGFTTFSGPVSVVGVTTYENATHFEDTIFVVNLKISSGNLTVSAPRTSFQNAEGTVGYSTFCPAGLNVSGIVTATSFVGNGSNLTGISANVGISTNLSGTFTASAGSPSTINTFGYGSGDIVVEYTVFIKNGSNYQSQKLLAMRDGTTIHSTQFAIMYSSSLLVQLDATISSGNILLRATPETGVSGSTTYKVKREVM